MKSALISIVTFAFASALLAQQPADPVLYSSGLPRYPAIALNAHITGEVTAEFSLDASGNVASVQILSGPPLLRLETEHNIRTWKFGQDPGLDDHSYKTTFTYRLSGRLVSPSRVPRLTVTVDSFRHIEIISDVQNIPARY